MEEKEDEECLRNKITKLQEQLEEKNKRIEALKEEKQSVGKELKKERMKSKRLEEKLEENKIIHQEERKNRFSGYTGLGICLDNPEIKAEWMKLPSAEVMDDLFASWNPFIVQHHNNIIPKDLKKELLMFAFGTGLPPSLLHHMLLLPGGNPCAKTIKNTIDTLLDQLQPWAQAQIKFPTVKEWYQASYKVYSKEKYK